METPPTLWSVLFLSNRCHTHSWTKETVQLLWCFRRGNITYNFLSYFIALAVFQNELAEIEKTVAKTQEDNMTIALTHYPSSIINTDHPRLRHIPKYEKIIIIKCTDLLYIACMSSP